MVDASRRVSGGMSAKLKSITTSRCDAREGRGAGPGQLLVLRRVRGAAVATAWAPGSVNSLSIGP